MRTNRIKFWISVGILLLFLASIACADGAKGIAIVLSTKGTVEIMKKGASWKPLKFGAVLDNEDRIKTGTKSFAAIVFTDDKSQLKLRPNTDITLNAERQDDRSLAKKVNMEIGELFAEVKKQKGSLQIATPTAVASVKGTQFWVIVLPDGTTQELTIEGIVTLLSSLTGETEEVIAGMMGEVDPEGNIDLIEIDPNELPETMEELGLEIIEINFTDEDGNDKTLYIQYQVEE
ncbi:MAG: FecR domain-containing protein [Candidatus Electryonea clarkiae]|nr:FecR domain-containing protein [Candidatus Electryonea clarkiae]MDP8285815.1 FecR domain-containing protein [Candidatus Electryonea clarkiae]